VRTDFTLSSQTGQVMPCNHLLIGRCLTSVPKLPVTGIRYSISKIPMFTFDAG
jgi:hypothetical protein